MRILLATALVAGCGFEHGLLLQPDAGSGPADDPTGDAPVAIGRTCKFPDPALRLCIEFDNHQFTPKAFDGSQYKLDATATHVSEGTRGTEPAAITYADSNLAVPEDLMLDIRSKLSFETWVYVSAYQARSLINNAGQYALKLEADGRVTCQFGNAVSRTPSALTLGAWHHLICGYDGQQAIGVAVDGLVVACNSGPPGLPTGGTLGTQLASKFAGMIDDVRIYARLLTEQELCMHSDNPACRLRCPGTGPDG